MRYLVVIGFFLAIMICSCNKPDETPVVSYHINDRLWTTDEFSIKIYDGFMFIRTSAQNEFGVRSEIFLKVNGIQEGEYVMNRDLSESLGYLNSSFLRTDPVFYSYNAFLPDTVTKQQVLTIRSIDRNTQKISMDFDFYVINSSTGHSDRVRGSIRNAGFSIDPAIKHNIVEIRDNSCFLGVLRSYDGYQMYFSEDNIDYVRLALPTDITTGTHHVADLPGLLYDQYFIIYTFRLSGSVTILEKNQSTGFIKGFYNLILTYTDGSTSTRKGYFSASEK